MPIPARSPLLGNPYATPIDFSLLTKSNLTDVAYIYDNASSNWVSSSPITGIGDFNGRISPFQGFFVQTAASGTPSVTFNDNAKVPTQTATFFGKQDREEDVHFIRLELDGEGLVTSTWVVFDEFGDHMGYAYGDAMQLTPYSDNHAILASRKTDGTLLDIGVFPDLSSFSDRFEIPVYIETTRSGQFILRATDLNLPMSMESLVLYDRERNVEIPVNQNMEYEFEINTAKKAINTEDDLIGCRLAGDDLALSGSPIRAKVTDAGSERFVITMAGVSGTPKDVPVYVSLSQNYPNPFNPSTRIEYELPKTSEVRLEVFDITSRHVATLVNGPVPAGVHAVTFDASDLTSGVYIYRLQVGDVVLTRKLTLLK